MLLLEFALLTPKQDCHGWELLFRCTPESELGVPGSSRKTWAASLDQLLKNALLTRLQPSVVRTTDVFQTGWVMSHLKEAEQLLGKPLLLEEFGKKLSAAEYADGSILGKRDPVFSSMYQAVESALEE